MARSEHGMGGWIWTNGYIMDGDMRDEWIGETVAHRFGGWVRNKRMDGWAGVGRRINGYSDEWMS